MIFGNVEAAGLSIPASANIVLNVPATSVGRGIGRSSASIRPSPSSAAQTAVTAVRMSIEGWTSWRASQSSRPRAHRRDVVLGGCCSLSRTSESERAAAAPSSITPRSVVRRSKAKRLNSTRSARRPGLDKVLRELLKVLTDASLDHLDQQDGLVRRKLPVDRARSHGRRPRQVANCDGGCSHALRTGRWRRRSALIGWRPPSASLGVHHWGERRSDSTGLSRWSEIPFRRLRWALALLGPSVVSSPSRNELTKVARCSG